MNNQTADFRLVAVTRKLNTIVWNRTELCEKVTDKQLAELMTQYSWVMAAK